MKNYKKILEGVINIINTTEHSDIGFVNICNYISENCPELTESEDEKIRKAIILFFELQDDNTTYSLIPKKDILAWLEKQGEQKPTDKVEPKFKVGDWVMNKLGVSWHIDSFDKKNYQVSDGKGNYNYFPILKQDEMHHWTIEDAKDGDVLASELCDSIILFGGIKDNNIDFYCDYDFSEIDIPGDRFAINNGQHYGNVKDSKDFQPATKEQRDLLFQKMKEAGYEFDFEKKELNKIEQKPTDKVEPKFKVGDWVVYCGKTCKITGLHNGIFTITYQNGSYFFNKVESTTEPFFHHWTIEDAKDGDVLIRLFGGDNTRKEQVFIFKCINNRSYVKNCIEYYCRVYNGEFYANKTGYMGTTDGLLYPATKEQRDLLFQKMKEDGYEFDFEKKELKKIG